MSGGRQADDKQLGVRIAEAGHRPAPIVPVVKGTALTARHFFAILHQARAFVAADYSFAQMREALGPRFAAARRSHPRTLFAARLRSRLGLRLASKSRNTMA